MIDILSNLITNIQGGDILSIFLAFGVAWMAGVLSSFTPCIFPMIPITFAIVSQVPTENNGQSKRRQDIAHVLLFGLGLSLSYVALGIIAVLSKGIFGDVLQTVWLKIVIANVFFFIALNAMGWIHLPKFSKQVKIHSKPSLIIFGILTGLTMSPCTLPVLAIVLAFASQTNIVIGGLLLWFYSWGFFLLLLLVAIFGKELMQKLPKSGPWLQKIEIGIALLCFSIGQWILLQSGGF